MSATITTSTTYLDSLLPVNASHVTPKELGGMCGYSSQHIIAAIDNGHLGAFAAPGKGGKETSKGAPRLHARIPVEMAHAYLLTHQSGLEDALILQQFLRAAARLPRRLKTAICKEITRQLATSG